MSFAGHVSKEVKRVMEVKEIQPAPITDLSLLLCIARVCLQRAEEMIEKPRTHAELGRMGAAPVVPTIEDQRAAMAHAQAVRMARYPRQEQRVRQERNNHGNGWAVEKFCPVCGRHWYSGGMCGKCRRAA